MVIILSLTCALPGGFEERSRRVSTGEKTREAGSRDWPSQLSHVLCGSIGSRVREPDGVLFDPIGSSHREPDGLGRPDSRARGTRRACASADGDAHRQCEEFHGDDSPRHDPHDLQAGDDGSSQAERASDKLPLTNHLRRTSSDKPPQTIRLQRLRLSSLASQNKLKSTGVNEAFGQLPGFEATRPHVRRCRGHRRVR